MLYKIDKDLHHLGFQTDALFALGDSSDLGLDKPPTYMEIGFHDGTPWLLRCSKFNTVVRHLLGLS
jgi:hypothetical protein